MKLPLLGLLFSLPACSTALPTGSSGSAIIQGTPDDGDPAVVAVLVQIPGQQGGALCTGEIVSPHVVLTAAHCTSPNSVGAGAQFFVYTGPSFQFAGTSGLPAGALPATGGYASPMWNSFGARSATDDDPYDIGVVILASPTDITPLSYNHFPLAAKLADTPARIVGYGLRDGSDSTGATAGTRYTAPTLVELVRPQGLELWDDAHATCEGDSGGPTLLKLDGKERIAAVTAFGYVGCRVDLVSTGTRVDTNAAFVDSYVNVLDPASVPPGGKCTADTDCGTLPCLEGVCAPPCDSASASCPAGLTCTSVDDSLRCAKPHGCALAGPTSDRSALVLVLMALCVLGLRSRRAFLSLLLSLSFVLAAPRAAHADPHFVDKATFDAIARELSGEHAQELVRHIVDYHRIQGSPMMADVAESVVLPALRVAGLQARIERFPSDGKTRYQTYLSPPAWKMRAGELWIDGDKPERLCRYSDVPMCVSTYSKGGTFAGELVDVGRGTRDSDYAGKSVAGKVVLASGYAAEVVRRAVIARGAVGAVIYPAADDRPDHPYMVRYNGVWPRADELDKTRGSFQISAAQYAALAARMARGAVRVRGTIDATLEPGSLTVVHAYLRGADRREVLLTAHLDHPKWSANDNASGSADLVEIARTLATLVQKKQLRAPRHTLHFMWVPEFFGTAAYLTRHPDARACRAWDDPRPSAPASACVLANLNLDMVGEDTVKTNSRFYITRAPASVPSFLDALLSDVLEQTRAAELYAPSGTRNFWPAEMAPPMGGSDHELFLGIGVPATMLGHDPDWTHHTSEDTPDKTDASELLRVGVLAAAGAWFIAAADDASWQRLAPAVAAEQLRADGARLVSLRAQGDARLSAIVEQRLAATAAHLADARLTADGTLAASAATAATPTPTPTPAPGDARGAHRLVIPPVDGDLFHTLTGDDRAWYEAERDKHDGFGDAVTETISLMDGRRSTAELADALSLSLARPVTHEWVARLVAILIKLGLAR